MLLIVDGRFVRNITSLVLLRPFGFIAGDLYEIFNEKNPYSIILDISAVVTRLWCLAIVCCKFTHDLQYSIFVELDTFILVCIKRYIQQGYWVIRRDK
jgi:hypothetical protein